MYINGLNIDGNKLNFLSKIAGNGTGNEDLSLFSKLSDIDSEMITDYLKKGFSAYSVISKLLNFCGVSNADDEIKELLKEQFKEMIDEAEENLREAENKDSVQDETAVEEVPAVQDEVLPDEIADVEGQNADGENKLVQNPISEDYADWNLEDTGNIFNSDTTKENFLEQFNALNEQNTEENTFSQYVSAINEAGAEKFFDILDENQDGQLDEAEISVLISADGNEKSISAVEFNNIFNKLVPEEPSEPLEETLSPSKSEDIPSEGPSVTPSETPPAVSEEPVISSDTPSVTPASQTPQTASPSGSTSSPSSTSTDDSALNTPETKKETVEDLVKQKQDIITEADTKIGDLNKQIDDLINNSEIEQQLKDDYNNAKDVYDTNQKSIKENKTAIEGYEKDIHGIDTSIAALDGEKSTLETNTDDPEVNQKNTARKAEIESKIAQLNTEKEKLEEKKTELEQSNTKLEQDATGLKETLDKAYTAVQEALPDEVKTQIDDLKTQIQTLETEKTAKVSELDSKIQTLKTQEIQESRKSGETVGKLASNSVGAKIVDDALKYLGYNEKDGSYKKFSTGDYGWCADFVTYVVKEVAQQMGMSDAEIKQLRTHLGASPYKLRTRNPEHYLTDKSQFQSQVQPGMAFICGGSGTSGEHTGLVLEVYDDGTFLTVEGNHDNKVTKVRRKLSDMKGFVDFTYLFK